MMFEQNGSNVLILWDVDHTLIETRGVGRAAFAAAFGSVTGHELRQMPHITGRTEPDIYAATIELHGITDPPPFSEFAKALASAYLDRQAELRDRGRAMPGALSALAHLAGLPGIQQSVLTGNTRSVARTKLETFSLDTYLDLFAGAYGDDNSHRPTLVGLAQHRAAARTGTGFGRWNTVLIGDSLGDIETARHGGAHVIAIAAGGSPASDLAVADQVLDDLTDPAALADSIRGLTG